MIHFYCLLDKSRIWLCKYMKNVRSSQPCISMNFCTESSSSTWTSLSWLIKGGSCCHVFQRTGRVSKTDKWSGRAIDFETENVIRCFSVFRGHPFIRSPKNDQFFDPNPHHPQKWTTDLLFKNSRIRKHVSNFKTPPPLPSTFHVDLINAWSLKSCLPQCKRS